VTAWPRVAGGSTDPRAPGRSLRRRRLWAQAGRTASPRLAPLRVAAATFVLHDAGERAHPRVADRSLRRGCCQRHKALHRRENILCELRTRGVGAAPRLAEDFQPLSLVRTAHARGQEAPRRGTKKLRTTLGTSCASSAHERPTRSRAWQGTPSHVALAGTARATSDASHSSRKKSFATP